GGADGGALAGGALDLEGAADAAQALPHAAETESAVVRGADAGAVVADVEQDDGAGVGEGEVGAGGAGVPGDVGEGFLGDPEEGDLDGGAGGDAVAGPLDAQVDAAGLAPVAGQGGHGLGELGVFQLVGLECGDGAAGLGEPVLGEGECGVAVGGGVLDALEGAQLGDDAGQA